MSDFKHFASGPIVGADSVDLVEEVLYRADYARLRRQVLLRFGLIVTGLAVLGIFIVSWVFDWNFHYVWKFEAAGLFGALLGTAELLSRYRDAPVFVLLSPAGIGYVAINAAAALAAMGIILAFDWDFGTSGDAKAATQVLVAGFGSMALFRSSLLTVKRVAMTLESARAAY